MGIWCFCLWVVPKKIQPAPKKEISTVRRARGEKFVSDNSKCIRPSKGVGGLTSNFLSGKGKSTFSGMTHYSNTRTYAAPDCKIKTSLPRTDVLISTVVST
jgi:hypothetical protein